MIKTDIFEKCLRNIDFYMQDEMKHGRAIQEISMKQKEIDWDRLKYVWNTYADKQVEEDLKKSLDRDSEERIYDYAKKIKERMRKYT